MEEAVVRDSEMSPSSESKACGSILGSCSWSSRASQTTTAVV